MNRSAIAGIIAKRINKKISERPILMKKMLKFVVLIIFLFSFILSFSGYASVPGRINYEGRLVDSNGSPVRTPKQFIFKIYDALSGGNLV